MSKLKDKIKNHPLLKAFEPAGDDVPDYKYYLALIDGYIISGYGGSMKHCETLKDVLHYLNTAIKGATPTTPKFTDEDRRCLEWQIRELETHNRNKAEYQHRVNKLEFEGLTRSDAQAIVDAEDLNRKAGN